MTEHTDAALDLAGLRRRYAEEGTRPLEIFEDVIARCDAYPDPAVWISRVPADTLRADAAAMDKKRISDLPLYGIPFAVKDNIDVAGMPTTAACPEFSYIAEEDAPAVARLKEAGAILIGKTNLDQFATGLVGVRSPYGACRNAFDPDYVSGGSSAGSAVAVAAGLVAFSLGTDTAGSGRVPAGFNNIVGLKPTKGIVSARGVVPACRSLDCVSVFALTTDDAATVLDVLAVYDADDAFARPRPGAEAGFSAQDLTGLRIGVPRASQREFFENDAYRDAYDAALSRTETLGATLVDIDFTPFAEIAALLYDGPWVAERFVALREFLETAPDSFHPVTRRIVEGGGKYSAADTFAAMYRLAGEVKRTAQVWQEIDFMLLPTAGSIYTVAEVEGDPVRLNTNLGYYTNFVNLLDMAAIAVPSGFTPEGLPFGVTLVGPAFRDRWLAGAAGVLHRAAGTPMGRTAEPVSAPDSPAAIVGERTFIAVNGAHMRGLPLNHQLIEIGADFVREDRTARGYRLFALNGLDPVRPGMVRDTSGGEIALEIWTLPTEAVGRFLQQIPQPLGLGKIEISTGDTVTGFLCEAVATRDAEDITAFGGWRAYLDAR